MPDGTTQIAAEDARRGGDGLSVRYDRPFLIGFITDARSEAALRDGLAEISTEQLDFRRGGVRAAIAAMQKQATPQVLLVDVSGEEQPLSALGELAHVVEPDVCVLVIGEISHMDFYREVTRGMGAADYLAKPLTRDVVARHFVAFLDGRTQGGPATPGGRSISLTGVRGGAGATTIAVNLAWHLGVTMRRHTVLLDPDILLGSAALMLNVQPGTGLRMALEAPERIDTLLAERAAQPAADRLHVLASEDKVAGHAKLAPGAAETLLAALRKRYNFMVADVPFLPVPLYRDLIDLTDQRVLVMQPTLSAVRDTLRLLALPAGRNQTQRPIVVLNRNGLPGGLTRRQVEDALKMKVDVVIPDLPRQVGNALTMGEPVITASSSFRAGILELARQVAFIGLLDSASLAAAGTQAAKGRGWWSLLRGHKVWGRKIGGHNK
jgi:pilus assembly protein CpaE